MRILRVLLVIVVVILVGYLSLAGSFGLGRGIDAIRQLQRLRGLRSESAPVSAVTEAAIPDETPLERVQVIATHNSYHLRAGPLQYFLIGLFRPGEPARLRYEHPTLYEQLELGVRGLELDVRTRAKRIIVSHVPMMDNRSTCPDFRLALEEIRIWSARHPAHVPISVLLELKEDWGFLDPRLKSWDAESLARLDALIREEFPEGGLLLPASDGSGWPRLGEARGRVLFILHVDPRITDLYRGSTLWRSRSGGPDARIQILNDPIVDAQAIRESLARGDLVRTRADADLARDPRRVEAALSSGAQIVSTDFPGSRGVSLPGGAMVRVLAESAMP